MELPEEMQSQARALGDPSRFRMFRHIVEATEPVTVGELTDLLGFNHNAIRQHLAVLVEQRLISEFDERRATRGRPRKCYVARADALSAFRSVSGSYERLAEILLELATSGDNPYEVGRRAARADHDDTTLEPEARNALVVHDLRVGGFDPTACDDGSIRLDHCPFADVAAQNAAIVCELHRGLIAGRIGATDPGSVRLVPKPPHLAGCIVSFTP